MADFAYAIMDSMQWDAIRLYRFHIDKSLIMPDYTWRYYDTRICYFNYLEDFIGSEIEFEYNVRDNEQTLGWMHTIEFEGEVPFDNRSEVVASTNLSICIDGERACPPDDVGYEEGYKLFIQKVMDENDLQGRIEELHRVYFDAENRLDFHPDKFDITKVNIRTALPYDVMWKDFPLRTTT